MSQHKDFKIVHGGEAGTPPIAKTVASCQNGIANSRASGES